MFKITRDELIAAFLGGNLLELPQGKLRITALEREDGSGFSFNVTGYLNSQTYTRTIYVRCSR